MSIFSGDQAINIIIKAQDQASKVFEGVSNNLDGMKSRMQSATAVSLALATGLAGAATAVGAFGLSAIKSAANMEQTMIAFETMLHGAENAKKFYADLVDFAAKTPFTLKGLEQSAKQLLAYGFAQNEVIPNMKILGDIAAGVGTDKLPQLILAFGQVKAATKLTGAELRQFTEAGVPLLQALADQANKTGGVMVQTSKGVKATSVNIKELNDKLAIAKQRLAEANKNAKTKTSTLMSLRNQVENYTQAINKANVSNKGVAASFTKVQVTAADMKQAISDGLVTFEDVQKALGAMTTGNGTFADLMTKQSQSLAGMWSNLGDAWEQFLRGQGQLLIEWAKQFVALLIDLVQNKLPVWIGKIKELNAWLDEHKIVLWAVAGALLFGLIPAAVAGAVALWALVAPLIPFLALGALVGIMIYNLNEIMKIFQNDSDMVLLGIKAYWQEFTSWLKKIILSIGQWFKGLWDGLMDGAKGAVNFLIGMAEGFANSWVKAANIVISALNSIQVSIPDWVPGIGGKSFGINIPLVPEMSLPRFEHGGIVPGARGTSTAIMAHGGERIVPAGSKGAFNGPVTYNVIINNPVVRNRDDAEYLRKQIEAALRDVTRGHKLSTI